MQVSFNPLDPQEAEAVQTLLALTAARVRVPDGSLPAPVALLAATDAGAVPGPAATVAPVTSAPKSHKKKPAPEAASTAAAPGVAIPSATPSIGDLLANSTPPAAASTVAENVPTPHVPAAPAPITGPTAAAGAKPLTVEDVRAAYRELFAVVGDEKGKEELRTVLAKAGAATVSDLKAEHYAATVRSLNAATILAKAKAAAPPAAAPAKDPLL